MSRTVPSAEEVAGNMVMGGMYRIVQVIPGVWLKPRESVMKYIGRVPGSKTLMFSARPLLGTQHVKLDTITELEQVANDELVYVAWMIGSKMPPEKWAYER